MDGCDFAAEDAFWRRRISAVSPMRPRERTKGELEHGGDFWPRS
jgi:hypothetical protein